MRGLLAITKRELRAYYLSPLFYVIAGVCAILWSYIFANAVDQFMGASLAQSMQSTQAAQTSGLSAADQGINLHRTVIAFYASMVNMLMLMACAALAMRLLTEEKKQRTFDLLLTSPITATDIALGKWLAGTIAGWGLLFVSLLYPLTLTMYGAIEWGPLATTYLALMMLTGVYIAVGLFASSLTESSVLAVLMAIFFNFMLFFISAPGQSVESPLAHAVFEQMNISTHLTAFIGGSISVAAVAFFASLIFLFTLLTQRVIESARWR